MRSRASLRLRQLKADRGPAAITHDEPHARATEKRQVIFAVGQSVPHPAAGVRHQGEYAAPRDIRRAIPKWTPVSDSDVIVLVPELMGEATRRGDRLDREAIFGAA